MGKFFAVLAVAGAVLFSNFEVRAGTPDQDPVVHQLSTMFRDGKTPTPESLQPGKTWRCIFHRAERDKKDVFEMAYVFGPLRADGIVPVARQPVGGDMKFNQFQMGWTSHGLIAFVNPEYLAVRQVQQNVLVFEYFTAQRPFLNFESLPQKFPAWTAPEETTAYAYAGCTL